MNRPSRVSSIHCSITGCRAATASSTGSSASTGRTYRRSAARCAKFVSRSASATAAEAPPDPSRRLQARSREAPAKMRFSISMQRSCAVRILTFVFLQLRRGEPLRIYQRLLALIVRRSQRKIGLRDLDVIAEDRVIANLQRSDSRPLPARALRWPRSTAGPSTRSPAAHRVPHPCPPQSLRHPPCVSGGSATSVVTIRAVTSSSVSRRRDQLSPQRRLHRLHRGLQARQPRQARGQRPHIARTGRIETQPRQQALQVENALECPPHFFALQQIAMRLGHRLIARVQHRRIDQRPQNRRAQQPLAHRRLARIERVKERRAIILPGKQAARPVPDSAPSPGRVRAPSSAPEISASRCAAPRSSASCAHNAARRRPQSPRPRAPPARSLRANAPATGARPAEPQSHASRPSPRRASVPEFSRAPREAPRSSASSTSLGPASSKLVQRLLPRLRAVKLRRAKLARRNIQQGHRANTVISRRLCPCRQGGLASKYAARKLFRSCPSAASSAVPGESTRVTSRLTIFLVSFGSSI